MRIYLAVLLISLSAAAEAAPDVKKLARKCREGSQKDCAQLADLARSSQDLVVKAEAIEQLTDQDVLADLALKEDDRFQRDSIAHRLDLERLTRVARMNPLLREVAVKRLTSASTIVDLTLAKVEPPLGSPEWLPGLWHGVANEVWRVAVSRLADDAVEWTPEAREGLRSLRARGDEMVAGRALTADDRFWFFAVLFAIEAGQRKSSWPLLLVEGGQSSRLRVKFDPPLPREWNPVTRNILSNGHSDYSALHLGSGVPCPPGEHALQVSFAEQGFTSMWKSDTPVPVTARLQPDRCYLLEVVTKGISWSPKLSERPCGG